MITCSGSAVGPRNFDFLLSFRDFIIWKCHLRISSANGIILMNLNWEGYVRNTQYQLATWKPSQHLIKNRAKPRKPASS
jgi:hypothetical protein